MKIEVRNVSKKFKNQTVLENINITFECGKIYSFIGRNGCGKTVFLKMLCGFYRPSEGNILYDGVDINKDVSFPPNTRALIERPSFISTFSGYQNLKLLADIQKKIGKEEIEKTLKLVHLYNDKDKAYHTYSLGMKQKLGIAQVLMENPTVIILDEPFNGIENTSVNELREILLEEKKRGKIIIIATHIKEDIEKLSDEIYFIDAKKIERMTKPHSLKV